jgi:hypothetical protein
MEVLMPRRRTLGMRVVVMRRTVMVVKIFSLDRWGEEKLGMNVRVRTVAVVVIKGGNLRLSKKAQKRDKDRRGKAAGLALKVIRQPFALASRCQRCPLLYERDGAYGCRQIACLCRSCYQKAGFGKERRWLDILSSISLANVATSLAAARAWGGLLPLV